MLETGVTELLHTCLYKKIIIIIFVILLIFLKLLLSILLVLILETGVTELLHTLINFNFLSKTVHKTLLFVLTYENPVCSTSARLCYYHYVAKCSQTCIYETHSHNRPLEAAIEKKNPFINTTLVLLPAIVP